MKLSTEVILAYSHAFERLSSGQYDNFRLMPCRVNGEPSLLIIALHPGEDDVIIAQPLFVAITPRMVISDEDGRRICGGGGGGPRIPATPVAAAARELTEPHPGS